jgi:Tol biopolymer transport system component/predicted Ser/Thr protein kinase
MSEPEKRSNDRGSKEGPPPTASFDSSVLGPSSRIGQFRIERELGRGGMGVVYLAHDTKLERSVAIKSLPADITDKREILSRWQHEARLLASLNHPNIATIHEVHEELDGRGYLVMEYIPGQTLADRLKAGLIPLDEALATFGQIAEGLEAAHHAGIIHRDLKPANIKITEEARVKILDFGIAKEVGEDVLDEGSTITWSGGLIGTPGYMSPEQARGMSIDKRADVWAFGCCLYEALTGRYAFKGDTASQTLAKILETEPNWSALPARIPSRIRNLLWRCLQKDPRRRLRDIGEAWFEIGETQSGASEAFTLSGEAAATSRLFRRDVVLVGLACLIVGLLIAGAIVRSFLRPSPPAPPAVSRLSINVPPDKPLYLKSSPHCFLILSPDGTRLVYVGEPEGQATQLYTRAMDDLEAKPIPGTEGAHNPFFSPDGQWVGFFTSALKKVSLAGGEPVTLLEDVPWGICTLASWADDGTIVFDAGSGLQRISADGGAPEILTAPDSEEGDANYRFPQVLPGGHAVLYVHGSRIDVFLPGTKRRRTILNNATYARYVNSGHLIFLRNYVLMAAPFDLARLRIMGPSVPLFERVRLDWFGSIPQIAISRSGTMVYASAEPESGQSTLVWVDRQGVAELVAAPARDYWKVRLSPDERQVAVTVRTDGFRTRVHLYDLSRGVLTQLTNEGYSALPQWSPDGTRVAFWSYRSEEPGVYWKAVDGGAPAELLVGRPSVLPCSWSSDGKLVACTVQDVVTQDDIWILSLDDERRLQPFLNTRAREYNPTFSRDGRWLAYTSNESGREQIYLHQYRGGQRKIQVSTEGGVAPVWSRDGRELYYANGNRMMVVPITLEPDFSVGKPELLFEGPYEMGGNFGQGYDVSSDGRRFLMIRENDNPAIQLTVVQNWFEELKRLAPSEGDG